MPSWARPLDSACTVAMHAAVTAGCRVTGLVTPVAEPQLVGGLGGQRQADVRVTGQVLRVDQLDAVETRRLGPLGLHHRQPRHAHAHRPHFEFRHGAIQSLLQEA